MTAMVQSRHPDPENFALYCKLLTCKDKEGIAATRCPFNVSASRPKATELLRGSEMTLKARGGLNRIKTYRAVTVSITTAAHPL
jgi:hypothetical protein